VVCELSYVPDDEPELEVAGAPAGSFVKIILFVSAILFVKVDEELVPMSLVPEVPMLSVPLRLHPTRATTTAVAANKCFFISFLCFCLARFSIT
jgi:hypothetical protein